MGGRDGCSLLSQEELVAEVCRALDREEGFIKDVIVHEPHPEEARTSPYCIVLLSSPAAAVELSRQRFNIGGSQVSCGRGDSDRVKMEERLSRSSVTSETGTGRSQGSTRSAQG